ncbi:MAG: two-component sensor histidine kinase, partial [Enterocloster citroniae]|nr:two-component sensor histidine kinase [Enterocloster citroniae]
MRQSIRVRFTMIFVGLMAAVLITLWAVNSFFLEGFYTKQKLKLLEDAYEQLNEFVIAKAEEGENITDDLQSLYSKDGEQNEASRMLRLMSEKYNTTIVIVDSMNDNTVPPFRDGRFLAERVHQYILGKNAPQTETLISEDNYKIQKSYDMRSQGYYLESWGFFDDNRTIFIMSMP